MSQNGRALLMILDGFGIGQESPFNAIKNAKMPFYKNLLKNYPHSQLLTHGEAVGLPHGVMGNSEVGHMTMGAGRIIYQDLSRISNSIQDRSFFKNKVLKETLQSGADKTGQVHLMGLLSDAGVHSHLEHLFALLDLCMEMKIPSVSVHPFLDGRDTPPKSGVGFLQKLLKHPSFQGKAKVCSLMGRYYAMDRDHRWERVSKAYQVLTGQVEVVENFKNPVELLEKSYLTGKTDEFVDPLLLDKDGAIKPGDSVVFFNYRSDRAREISEALTSKNFSGFDRLQAPKLSAYCGMTIYDSKLGLPGAFLPQNFDHIFGEWLEESSLTQFRIAETEKYAHVTFFFNGGREKPFQGEDRMLIPSPRDVPTYDLKPEMSAFQVAEEAVNRILQNKYHFILMNFANADMVGHTGNYEAAVRAMESLDQCLEKVIGAAEKNNYPVILTADHGNAEEMRDGNGQIHTQHTINPVPAIWIAPGSAIAPKNSRIAMRDGGLQDILPTLCDLMKLPIPKEVTGKSLVTC